MPIIRGIINSFGVFQTYYQAELLRHKSPSAISWIGSAQSFFLLVVGVVSGPLYDRGRLRLLLGSGTALVVLGLMATSACTRYWQVVLAQGACVGVGTGLLYIPSLATVPRWFGRSRRRALALGIVTSGSSVGGVVYSLLFQAVLPRAGFAWAVRACAFVSLATVSVALAVLRLPPREQTAATMTTAPTTTAAITTAAINGTKTTTITASSSTAATTTTTTTLTKNSSEPRRPLLDLGAFRERPYVLYCAAMAPTFLAFQPPMFYLQPYALSHGLAGRPDLALHLVALLNAASVPGRIAPSFVAGRAGPVQAFFLSVALTGAAVLAWIGTRGDTTDAGTGTGGGGTVAFAVAFGFFSGGIVALPAVVLASFTRDLGRLGTRLGMSSLFNAVGSLAGAPASAAIMGATGGDYLAIQLFSGLLFVASALLLVALRFVLTGRRLLVKV